MQLPTYFETFLSEIRPTDKQQDELQTGHSTLRDRLNNYEGLKAILVSDFLQGSYRRATAIRPKADKRSDVDIIIVTKLSSSEYSPQEAMDLFVPFLDTYYKGKYEFQGRSIGIGMSYVDLDLVITAAPSEAEIGILKSLSVQSDETPEDVNDWRLVQSWVPLSERYDASHQAMFKASQAEAEWKSEPLLIPDRDADDWKETDPLEQIKWTWAKNRETSGHYVNVVKALKWWRRVKCTSPTYPKGYPVEHIIGQNCPDDIGSVAEGVVSVLEAIAANYQTEVALGITPTLPDHGVPAHNVFHRVTAEQFAEFHSQVCEAATIARTAFDAATPRASSEAWRELFGDKFPQAPEEGSQSKGFTQRSELSTPVGSRFA